MHWNSNSIKSKYEEFVYFLEVHKLDIVSLNETKLCENDNFNIRNYQIIRFDRNSRGGGVAILISDKISYEQIGIFDKFNLELVAIKIRFKNSFINLISWYLAPQAPFPDKLFFQKLYKTKNLIIMGDFN